MTVSFNQLAFIGSLGTPELVLIFVVVLLLFGAKKLPELARGMGKSMGEFKRAREEFEHEITRAEAEASTPEKKESKTDATTDEKKADKS